MFTLVFCLGEIIGVVKVVRSNCGRSYCSAARKLGVKVRRMLVGVGRFELPTSSSRTKRPTVLGHTPT